MERDRYPDNWNQMSLKIRIAANHKCQMCGKECRRPSEKLSDFVLRIYGGLKGDRWEEARDAIDHPQKYRLTGAHLDQNPANNHPSNLKALCMCCHINHDRDFLAHNAIAKRERRGQTKLPI
jgi:nitrate/TMAO reductase-like tetraheme cytochrome c subunit